MTKSRLPRRDERREAARRQCFLKEVTKAHNDAVAIAHDSAWVEAEVAFREVFGRRFQELYDEFFEMAIDEAGAA